MTPSALRLCIFETLLRHADAAHRLVPRAYQAASEEIAMRLDVDLGAELHASAKSSVGPVSIDAIMTLVDRALAPRVRIELVERRAGRE